MQNTLRLRVAVGTAIATTTLGVVAGFAFAQPASANEMCYGAGVYGTVTGTHSVGPYCILTNGPTVCVEPSAGLTPTLDAWVTACA